MSSWDDFEKYLVETRYSIRNKDGEPLEHSYDEVIKRVIEWLNRSNAHNKLGITHDEWITLCEMLINKKIVPATPVLMNANSPSLHKTHFSCFPLGYVGDSLTDIMDMASTMSHIFRCGGGCGIDISKLRPQGSLVSESQGKSSGPISFMNIFDSVAGTVSQGGKRRGALMISMDDSHEDIYNFIHLKEPNNKIKNANLSVRISSKELLHVWLNNIAEAIWHCGDPGLLFLENHMANTPIPSSYRPFHVNPCAEYMAPAMTACNLVSINLHECGDLEDVEEAAYYACIFANEVLAIGEFPNKQIEAATRKLAPVGIGVTGLHMYLYRSGGDYDIHNLDIVSNIYYKVLIGALEASKKYGPLEKIEINPTYISKLRREGNNLTADAMLLARNGCLTIQAPAGSISQLVHCPSTGIEPLYNHVTTRKVVDIDGSMKEFVLDSGQRECLTAHDISPETQLKFMAAAQQWVHGAISKTINVPANTTVDDIKQIIVQAYKMGLKAISIYRDQSKDTQILTSKETIVINSPVYSPPDQEEITKIWKDSDEIIEMPDSRNSKTFTIKGPMKIHCTITYLNDKPREIFFNGAKSGTAFDAMLEMAGRAISISLRRDENLVEKLSETFRGIDSGYNWTIGDHRFKSPADAVGWLLKSPINEGPITNSEGFEKVMDQKHYKSWEDIIDKGRQVMTNMEQDICPSCGCAEYIRKGGCRECRQCGYSSC